MIRNEKPVISFMEWAIHVTRSQRSKRHDILPADILVPLPEDYIRDRGVYDEAVAIHSEGSDDEFLHSHGESMSDSEESFCDDDAQEHTLFTSKSGRQWIEVHPPERGRPPLL